MDRFGPYASYMVQPVAVLWERAMRDKALQDGKRTLRVGTISCFEGRSSLFWNMSVSRRRSS